jgi:hypothetical protein
MTSFLRIVRHPYEEPHHVNLVVSASNGRQTGQIEIYDNAESLAKLARQLRTYPTGTKDLFLWELGSELPADRFGFYFRIRISVVSPRGLCSVEFRFNNNEIPPERELTEFSFTAEPADLERLARLLEGFSKLEDRVLEWTVTDGQLIP